MATEHNHKSDSNGATTRAMNSGLTSLFRGSWRSRLIILAVVLTGIVIAVSLFDLGGIEKAASSRDLEQRLLAPGAHGHLLGTDGLGRDVLARVIVGSRYTFGIAALATAIAAFIGIPLGLLGVIGPGWLRALVGRIVDLTIAFPSRYWPSSWSAYSDAAI